MALHFVDLLERLKSRIARMTAMVQQELEMAVEAVFTRSDELSRIVIDGDRRIDDEEVEVEKQAIELLALYQPAACDLRLITTIIKADSDFERIADCAVNIAQRVALLAHVPDYDPPPDLRVMANSVVATLRDTIKAFNLMDAAAANQVLANDDVIDALYSQIVTDMITTMESGHIRAQRDVSNIMIAKNLERIGDHCTNICEYVIYVNSGRIIRHAAIV